MSLRRMTATLTAAALLLGAVAAPVLADRLSLSAQVRVSESFQDMDEYGWGLKDVTRLTVKGIFKGRAEGVFAPGAKITHQETAVALVRLMDREAQAEAMSEAKVEAALKGMTDWESIAPWAQKSVALLAEAGVIADDHPFAPGKETTRLEIAVMLVKAMGYQAEARAKANAELAFKDAHLIPAEAVGYVAAAVDHKLITGYEDMTFRPHQAVKRVEMAVMLGRADAVIGDQQPDEYVGVIRSVNTAEASLVIRVRSKDISLDLAENASIFVDGVERDLADLRAGMRVQVELNAAGEAVFVEARTEQQTPTESTIEGTITNLVPANLHVLALVEINGTVYPISPIAEILINGQVGAFTNLRTGDSVKATATYGVIHKLEATRNQTALRTGMISQLTAATATSPAKLTLTYPSLTTPAATEEFALVSGASVKVNGEAAAFADLRVGDSADLILQNGKVAAIDAVRVAITVSGTIVDLTPATSRAQASLALSVNGSVREYKVAKGAEITLNGDTTRFANLRVGDQVTLTVGSDMIDAIEASRAVVTTVEGTIAGLAAPSDLRYIGRVTVSHRTNGSMTFSTYDIPAVATLKLNTVISAFGDLQLNDDIKITLENNVVTQVEVTR